MKNHNARPLTALTIGLLAGAAGSAAQSLFFKLTARITPLPPKNAFTPPDPIQRNEPAPQTVARRFVHGFMRQGDLNRKQRELGGTLVHYGFGALWGAVYAHSRESVSSLNGPLGVTTFSTGVWMVSDNLILPSFKLAGWPNEYPAKNHFYAVVAHLVYGATVWGVYEGAMSLLSGKSETVGDMKIDVIPSHSHEDVPYIQEPTHLRDAS